MSEWFIKKAGKVPGKGGAKGAEGDDEGLSLVRGCGEGRASRLLRAGMFITAQLVMSYSPPVTVYSTNVYP